VQAGGDQHRESAGAAGHARSAHRILVTGDEDPVGGHSEPGGGHPHGRGRGLAEHLVPLPVTCDSPLLMNPATPASGPWLDAKRPASLVTNRSAPAQTASAARCSCSCPNRVSHPTTTAAAPPSLVP
jgi:hypothetical protein